MRDGDALVFEATGIIEHLEVRHPTPPPIPRDPAAGPSYARALDEARLYRHLFPLGAPTDRDQDPPSSVGLTAPSA